MMQCCPTHYLILQAAPDGCSIGRSAEEDLSDEAALAAG